MCLIIFSAVTCWTGMKPALYRPTFRWHINLSLCSVVPLSPPCASTLMASEMGIGGVYYSETWGLELRAEKAQARTNALNLSKKRAPVCGLTLICLDMVCNSIPRQN